MFHKEMVHPKILIWWKPAYLISKQVIKTSHVKTVQNSSKQAYRCIWMWEDNRGWSLFTGISIVMDLYFDQKHWSKVKMPYWWICFSQTCRFSLHKMFNGLGSCGLLWCFYQLFGLSFWRHPFTAEDQFMSKWCNAKFLQICSDKERNSSIS